MAESNVASVKRAGGLVSFSLTQSRLRWQTRRRNWNNCLLVFAAGFSVNSERAGIHYDLPVGLERLAFDASDARRYFKLRCWIKNGDCPARNHVKNLSLKLIEMRRRSACRNDSVVIANLCVVENPFRRFHPIVAQSFFRWLAGRIVKLDMTLRT